MKDEQAEPFEQAASQAEGVITDAMNRVVDATSDATDPFTATASQRTLARVEWSFT